MNIEIEKATIANADTIAVMVKDLLTEIKKRTGIQHFSFDLKSTSTRCRRSNVLIL